MVRQLLLSASIGVCGLACARSVAAQDRALTERELVQIATTRNRDVLAAREQIAEAQGLLRQAGIRVAPTVEIEGSTGRPLGTHGEEEYSVGYFHPLETAGKRGKRVDVSQAGVALAEAEFADRLRNLTLDVTTRAVEAYGAQQKRDALERLLEAGQESLRLTKARVDEGDAAPLDEQLLATELNRNRAQQVSAAGRARSALSDVRRAVGLDQLSPLLLAAPTGGSTVLLAQDLVTRALQARPDVQASRIAEHQAGAELALSHAQGTPDITASAKYTHRTSTFDNLFGVNAVGVSSPLRDRDNVLTLGVSIPLVTPGRNRGNVDAATAKASAARQRREALEAAVPQEIEAAYQRWIAAKDVLGLFEQGIVDQSKGNLAVLQQSYTLGESRLTDVLAEQRRLIDTELAYIDAQTELAQARAELEHVVGSELP